MSPTIYDIARVAGVSKSTVSRVLNKQTNISPEARVPACLVDTVIPQWPVTLF
ncbi:LacI family DNA-binding transcriptional regulator, partial [Escherichia coli]|uniref:LacI family DNA-binding transcriptional regulator n=1 Tax=Escherichia coli TaxID=562 RepID=UPI003EE2D36E